MLPLSLRLALPVAHPVALLWHSATPRDARPITTVWHRSLAASGSGSGSGSGSASGTAALAPAAVPASAALLAVAPPGATGPVAGRRAAAPAPGTSGHCQTHHCHWQARHATDCHCQSPHDGAAGHGRCKSGQCACGTQPLPVVAHHDDCSLRWHQSCHAMPDDAMHAMPSC